MRHGWILALLLLTFTGCHDRDDKAGQRRERTDSYGQSIEIHDSDKHDQHDKDKKHDDDDDDDDD